MKKLKTLIKKELHIDLCFIGGAHGGVLINDIDYCGFEPPIFALDTLKERKKLAKMTNMPYNFLIMLDILI